MQRGLEFWKEHGDWLHWTLEKSAIAFFSLFFFWVLWEKGDIRADETRLFLAWS